MKHEMAIEENYLKLCFFTLSILLLHLHICAVRRFASAPQQRTQDDDGMRLTFTERELREREMAIKVNLE